MKTASQRISKDLNVHDQVFENCISLDELLAQLNGKYKKTTIYKWVSRGMPRKLIAGRLYFSPDEVALWLKRTNRNGGI